MPFVIPATESNIDYKALVKEAYDTCAAAYDASRKTEPGTETRELLNRLDDGDTVLDIGCGAGVPIAASLAARYRVTGVDISPEMIQRAQENVPAGEFVCADIMSATFPPFSFDAVVAFYSVFHLPRQEHAELFRRIQQWLNPGGYLLCTLSHYSETGYTEDDFFGETMYWSNYSLSEYARILNEAGFALLESNSTGSGYEEAMQEVSENHPLVLARKR